MIELIFAEINQELNLAHVYVDECWNKRTQSQEYIRGCRDMLARLSKNLMIAKLKFERDETAELVAKKQAELRDLQNQMGVDSL